MNKAKVAFICTHNSCRSQIAEALGKYYADDLMECYSAGTETKPAINSDAVRLVKEIYGIDMSQTQYSKTLDQIPPVDIVITMGCGVQCPYDALLADMEARIKAVDDADYRDLLSKRYLEFKSWNMIAADFGYSVQHIYRLRDKAVQKLRADESS